MYYIKKRMEIAGSHSLRLSYESKCSRIHGHNWVITVYCRASELNADGMVADFTHIKQRVHDRLDHADLNSILPFNPTAENIARWVCGEVPGCFIVTVRESEGNSVMYVASDASAADIAAAGAL
ncbi:MAG: 6-carboxytetrahydropterin synthase [Bacteroidales bacterium]|nr:6-carboxytetrahydropterin synthase [Bacteroidales bacterium]